MFAFRTDPAFDYRLIWLVPVLLFYSLLVCFGQNIPTIDDFQATLNFVYAFFFTGKSGSEQWTLLFSQHNEHRILSSRLLALTLYKLTGHVNLLTMLWVQQLFWLAFVAIIIRVGQSIRLWRSAWLGLPVVLLLFHPNTFDTLLHVWGGSQTYPVLSFTIASLYSLHRSTNHPGVFVWLLVSIITAGLATFSFGSGFLVWLGGAAYLLLTRRYYPLIGWLIAAALAVGFYLWPYEQPVHTASLTQPIGSRLLSTAKFVLLFPGAPFMSMWPSVTLALPNLLVCYGIGIGSWLYTIQLLRTGYGFRNPFLCSLLAVSLATCLLLALGRNGLGTNGALVSRYQVFANMIPLTFYLIWVDQLKRTNPGWLPYACSILLSCVCTLTVWQLWPSLAKEQADKERGLRQWVQHRTPTLAIENSQQQSAGERLERCLQTGIYSLPPMR